MYILRAYPTNITGGQHLADTVLMDIIGTMIIKKPPSPSKLQPAETLHCMEKMPGFLQQASALLANYSTSQS